VGEYELDIERIGALIRYAKEHGGQQMPFRDPTIYLNECNPEFWAGYCMGRLNKNMEADEVIAILLEAFKEFEKHLRRSMTS